MDELNMMGSCALVVGENQFPPNLLRTKKDSFGRVSVARERRSYRWLNEPVELPARLSFAFEPPWVRLGVTEMIRMRR